MHTCRRKLQLPHGKLARKLELPATQSLKKCLKYHNYIGHSELTLRNAGKCRIFVDEKANYTFGNRINPECFTCTAS